MVVEALLAEYEDVQTRIGRLLGLVVMGAKRAPNINPSMGKMFYLFSPQWLLSDLILRLICNLNSWSLLSNCIL